MPFALIIGDDKIKEFEQRFYANPTKWRWRQLQHNRAKHPRHYYTVDTSQPDNTLKRELWSRQEVNKLLAMPHHDYMHHTDGSTTVQDIATGTITHIIPPIRPKNS